MKVRIEIEAKEENARDLRDKFAELIRKINRRNRIKGIEKVEYEITLKTHMLRSVGFKED